jgi:hypothetical protein
VVKEADQKRNNLKKYTVYDNASGGYTVWYQFYDYSVKDYVMKDFNAYDKTQMLKFTKQLELNGYKFVGKL